MDRSNLLKADHDDAKALLTKLDKTTERAEVTRTDGLEVLPQARCPRDHRGRDPLPGSRGVRQYEGRGSRSLRGAHVVDMVMSELEALSAADETWAAKLTVAKENLDHRIEEEEGEMFKQARQLTDNAELDHIGDRLAARKRELMAGG